MQSQFWCTGVDANRTPALEGTVLCILVDRDQLDFAKLRSISWLTESRATTIIHGPPYGSVGSAGTRCKRGIKFGLLSLEKVERVLGSQSVENLRSNPLYYVTVVYRYLYSSIVPLIFNFTQNHRGGARVRC